MSNLVEILKVSNNREEALNYIKTNKLKLSDLKDVMQELEIWYNCKWNKARIIEHLIENTIGARLRIKSLMNR